MIPWKRHRSDAFTDMLRSARNRESGEKRVPIPPLFPRLVSCRAQSEESQLRTVNRGPLKTSIFLALVLFGHLRLTFNFHNHRKLKVNPRSLTTPNTKKIGNLRGSLRSLALNF